MSGHFMHLTPLIQAIAWSLLHFVWQGCVIGLVYGFVRTLLPPERSSARYAAGLAALAIMALCPLLTFAVQYAPSTMAAVSAPDLASIPSAVAASSVVASRDSSIDFLLPWLVFAWIGGVMLMALRAWRQWCAIDEIAKCHANANPALDLLLAALSRQFGLLREIRVRVSDRIETPMLIGWLKPLVLLPTAVALGFPRHQLELILAHELGHLRRYDHLVNLAQTAIETLLFYHPVVHWISRDVRNEREVCCDRLVLQLTRGEPHEYARTLASLEEVRRAPPRFALAASGGVLLERVRRIVGMPASTLVATRPGFGVVFLVASTLVLIVTFAWRSGGVDEWTGDAQVLLDRIPPPTGLALGSLALHMPLPPAWNVKIATPAIVALPAVADAPTHAISAGHHARSVDPIPRSTLLHAALAQTAASAMAAMPVADIAVATPQLTPAVPATVERRTAMPVVVRSRAPSYPQGVAEMGKVTVDVSFAIAADGSVRDVRAGSGSAGAAFAAAAREALANWRFDPATVAPGNSARYQQTFVFSKQPAQRARAVAEDVGCVPRTGSLICRAERAEKVALPLTIIQLTDTDSAPPNRG